MGEILFSNIKTHETILELWGASTKHPDSRFYFSNFELPKWAVEEEAKYLQVFQWLLECASKLNFPPHAKNLTKLALAYYDAWEKGGD